MGQEVGSKKEQTGLQISLSPVGQDQKLQRSQAEPLQSISISIEIQAGIKVGSEREAFHPVTAWHLLIPLSRLSFPATFNSLINNCLFFQKIPDIWWVLLNVC